jgi:glutamine amidotransferase
MNSKASICILDYGSGNVASVRNTFASLGFNAFISNRSDDIKNCTHLVLPGVGAFGASMRSIEANVPLDSVKTEILKGKPFLGICVGMQVLATKGLEDGEHAGLNLLPGTVERFKDLSVPVPHVGWNDLIFHRNNPLFLGLEEESDFYFVHSYHFFADQGDMVIATTNYEVNFVSAVAKDNIFGVQFHPEKSQKNGRKLLTNFAGIH